MAMPTIEDMRRAMGRTACVVSKSDSGTSTLYVKQDARVVDFALAVATGATPDVGFACEGDRCWFILGFIGVENAPLVTLPFIYHRDRDVLLAILGGQSFTLQVEGAIPVDIPAPKGAAFRQWMARP